MKFENNFTKLGQKSKKSCQNLGESVLFSTISNRTIPGIVLFKWIRTTRGSPKDVFKTCMGFKNIFRVPLYCYFGFFWNNLAKIRLLFINARLFSFLFFCISTDRTINNFVTNVWIHEILIIQSTLTSVIKGHVRLFFSRKKSTLPSDFHVIDWKFHPTR